MRSYEERVAETKRRIAKIEREKRLRRNTITMVSAVAACLVLLIGASLAMPGIAASIRTGIFPAGVCSRIYRLYGLKERCPVRRRNVSRNDHPGSSGKRTYDLADAEFHAEHHHRRDHHSRGCGPEAWSGEVDHVSSNL